MALLDDLGPADQVSESDEVKRHEQETKNDEMSQMAEEVIIAICLRRQAKVLVQVMVRPCDQSVESAGKFFDLEVLVQTYVAVVYQRLELTHALLFRYSWLLRSVP